MPHLRGEGERGWALDKGTSKGFNKNKIPPESPYVPSFLSQERSLQELGGGAVGARGPQLDRPWYHRQITVADPGAWGTTYS